jgi:hypothetical protein
MNTVEYIFRSPYSSPVQVGIVDPASIQKQDSSQEQTLMQQSDMTLQKASQTMQSLKGDVKPTVQNTQKSALLDIYA